MALFEVSKYDTEVYEKELKDFLPKKMIDIHTHVYLDRNRPQPWMVDGVLKPTSTFWASKVAYENSIEDLMETYKLMFPEQDVKALMFNNGVSAADNIYVSQMSKLHGWPALYYSTPDQSAEELEKLILDGGFLGLKSYLDTSPKYIPVKEIRIYDFFPKEQLAMLDKLGAICMCHIPRDARLKDPVNLHQLVEISHTYPNIRFIVAHVGRAYVSSDIGNAFELLDTAPGLYYDFSANCYDVAIREVIKHAGVKKVMFGTDMPILRMRCHRIEENGTYINLVPPGLYGGAQEDPHLREVTPEEAEKITFFAYEELLAFKRAARELNLSKQDIEDILYNNADALIKGAQKSIYGT